ncbi:sulfatase family protein [Pontiella agarivorans]|uniref:Sulfatase n=1 Tax=Pontiella agarivorans TaxID=3038953 RepID=A0ABU5MS41_9BACT|nr:sulfatase [Pontiella agarivorans]MDZ8117029.1 sulfatase [Pontiella agarivorans]
MKVFVYCALLMVSISAIARPNIIIILTDDQGYNDLGCYGSETIKTPRIDQMAKEGMRLTSFYAAAPLCGQSRSALLTGCYSQRLAELGDEKEFHTTISPEEILLSEVLKKSGYITGCIGKWHLAGTRRNCISSSKKEGFGLVHPEIMPMQKGFDSYLGIPYSNDTPPIVLMRGNEIIEELGRGEKQTGITTRYTDEALRFIEDNQQGPFFLYLAHNMPHAPLWPGKDFEGKSEYGRYGDCVEEIDWNTGRILDKLKELGIDEKTIVIYMSDNGPWLRKPKDKGALRFVPDASYLQGGCADPLRGSKMTTYDGGLRVPCIIRWPKSIAAGRVSDELVSALDWFPTLARFANAQIPTDRTIDGVDQSAFLTGKSEHSSRQDFYYYKWLHLHAVRSGDWKLVLPREAKPADLGWYNKHQEAVTETTLYHLKKDIGETTNVAKQNPEVVSRLMKIIEKAQRDLGDQSRGIDGQGIRHTNK